MPTEAENKIYQDISYLISEDLRKIKEKHDNKELTSVNFKYVDILYKNVMERVRIIRQNFEKKTGVYSMGDEQYRNNKFAQELRSQYKRFWTQTKDLLNPEIAEVIDHYEHYYNNPESMFGGDKAVFRIAGNIPELQKIIN